MEPLALTMFDHKRSTRVREGKQHTQDSIRSTHTHTHKPRLELKTRRREFTTQTELKSLTQQSKCVEVESRSLKMFRECLVYCSMRLVVPFIVPRQLGAVGDQLGRQISPSVEWCTGQSGAPPDMNSKRLVHDLLPNRAQSTVGPRVWLAHRTLSDAHWTVRCAQPTVGAGHASPADCVADRWPQAPLVHRTVRCTTGQSDDFWPHRLFLFPGAASSPPGQPRHRTVQCARLVLVWLITTTSSSLLFLFLAMPLALR
jgi:hypothetical protein